MRRLLLSALLLIGSCTIPAPVLAQNPNTAVFPGSTAADSDLFVAHNKSQSNLSSSIISSDTSLTVADASSFTAPAILTIESEVLHCTTITTNTFSGCTRGQEGTTGAGHSSGVTVFGLFTAYQFNQTNAEIKALESWAGFGGVLFKTGSYTVTSTDNQKVIVAQCSSACNITLPASAPATVPKFRVRVINFNSSVATVVRNSLTINALSSDLPLGQGSFTDIATDGSNYQATPVVTAGSSMSVTCTATGCSFNPNLLAVTAIATLEKGNITTVISSNGTTAYTGSPVAGCGSPSTVTLTAHMGVHLVTDTTNTSSPPTFAYCGLTAANVVGPDGATSLTAGAIPVNAPGIDVTYDGSVWRSNAAAAGWKFDASATLGTITASHLACFTASNTIGNCTGTPSGNVIGVFAGTAGYFIQTGKATVALDATVSVTFGDNLCASAISANTAHDNGATVCPLGTKIGVVETTASSVSTATAVLNLQ